MKINNLPKVFTAALPVLKEINEAGYEAYFVGGSVRDLLLNRHIHDVDIATSAYPIEIKQILRKQLILELSTEPSLFFMRVKAMKLQLSELNLATKISVDPTM